MSNLDEWLKKHKIFSRFGWLCLFVYLFALLYFGILMKYIVNATDANAYFVLNILRHGEILSQKEIMPAWVFPLLFIKPLIVGFLCGRFTSRDD